jgi:hypothetical protein
VRLVEQGSSHAQPVWLRLHYENAVEEDMSSDGMLHHSYSFFNLLVSESARRLTPLHIVDVCLQKKL